MKINKDIKLLDVVERYVSIFTKFIDPIDRGPSTSSVEDVVRMTLIAMLEEIESEVVNEDK